MLFVVLYFVLLQFYTDIRYDFVVLRNCLGKKLFFNLRFWSFVLKSAIFNIL